MHVDIHAATISDAEAFAPLMREADVLESKRSSDFAPLEAFVRSVLASDESHAIYIDGEPVAMLGLSSPELPAGVGVPWMLTCVAAERHPVAVFKTVSAFVEEWNARFPTLIQFVDEEHAGALRFVQALGFSVQDAIPFGVGGAKFCPIVRSRHV